MPASNKNTLIIVCVVAGALVLMCLIAGGVYLLSRNSTPATPVQNPVGAIFAKPTQPSTATEKATEIQIITEIPTLEPPVVQPPAPTTPPTEDIQPPSIFTSDTEINLNGTPFKVFSVAYTLLNGGEDGVIFINDKDKAYFLVTLVSNDKDMRYIYKDYGKQVTLFDPLSGQYIEYDYMYWSDDESPVNSGYVKISFPVSAPLSKAILHITDGVDIDISPLIPLEVDLPNPWIDATREFNFYNIPMRIAEVGIYDDYNNPIDGEPIGKEKSTDKVFVVRLSSQQNDLSFIKEVAPFILVDGNNQKIQYQYAYRAWSNENRQGDGYIYFIYVVPENYGSNYVLYIPYDTLMDITPFIEIH